MSEEADFQRRMQRIESLVHEIESVGDPRVQSRAVELVSLLMELHGAGLARMLELLAQDGANAASAPRQFAADPLVGSLLLLYGLHPVDLETRVHQALDKVRPLLKSHGGNVELLGIGDGVVRLQLQGSCHGCPSSTQTLHNAIQAAIDEFAPDVVELKVEGVAVHTPPVSGFVPLAQLV
ncbi:MAG TPA: NifU family protein [Pirellulales bacterium]|jgi:Fe-S cluster biogenesis protein NfuA|nr:NifU family protein [Pirellulales bacterium]